MEGVVRMAAISSRQYSADPAANLDSIMAMCKSLEDADIILLPQLALSSPCCGNLFSWNSLLENCQKNLEYFCASTRGSNSYYIIGLPVYGQGGTASGAAVVHGGRVLGIIPSIDIPADGIDSCKILNSLPVNTVFDCGGLKFCILPCNPSDLPRHMHLLEGTGCGLVLVPTAVPAKAGELNQICRTLEVVSESWSCAVAVASAGPGGASSPKIYAGISGIYERGKQLCFSASLYEETNALCDLDPQILRSAKTGGASAQPVHSTRPAAKRNFIRPVDPNPFTAGFDKPRLYEELFELQSASIVLRLKNTGMEKLVLGLSGGLDSTLAALAGAHALDMLGKPRKNLICIKMPGFGTGNRTKSSSDRLAEVLEADAREIPISDACTGHLKDIGHDGRHDTAYENVQARERSQILFDVANMENAVVLGTGDLSEESLGWATFGGDHLAGFNVNVCLTKTVIRGMVNHISDIDIFHGAADVLQQVLNTPVSPELLPPDSEGHITQKTEEILGPYELHEFFLYYFVRYNMSPSRILEYACAAFGQAHDRKYIGEKLEMFLRRFATGQFKRACAPDAAEIFSPNLSISEFTMPSDLKYNLLTSDIHKI